MIPDMTTPCRGAIFSGPWKALSALIVALAGGSHAQAQQVSAPMTREAVPVALSGTEHDLVSAVNGQPYRLYVALPAGYDPQGGTRYPVLYLLDGYYAFPAAVSALGSMAIQREVEDVIVVGIGDGEHAFDSWFASRWRDYTPTLDAATDSAGATSFGIPRETVYARLRYNRREGQDLYLVFNDGLNTERDAFEPGLPLSAGRTLLLKYSHAVAFGW